MYENIKTTIVAVGIFVICMWVALTTGSLVYRMGQYREQCENYRAELKSAENRQQQLKDAVGQCIEIVGRSEELFSSSATTVRQLKEQLKEARKNYEDMERLLYSIYDNNTDSYNNSVRDNKE